MSSAYLLALGVGLCLTPWLTSRFGSRRVYAVSLALFTLTSAGCALAGSLSVLIAARTLQGLVAAPMVPVAMTALLGTSEVRRDVSAAAGVVLFAAPAFGPVVGGVVLDLLGWPATFWINVPVGVAGLWGCRALGSVLGSDRVGRPFDVRGLALLAPGLVAVLWSSHEAPAAGWASAGVIIPLACGSLALGCFVVHAARHTDPLVRVRLLGTRAGLAGTIVCSLASVVAYATVFFIPVYLQRVQHHSAVVAGLALLPAGVVTGLGSVAGESAVRRWGLRPVAVAGLLALGAVSALFVGFSATTALGWSCLVLGARSLAVGLVTTPVLTVISASVPAGDADDVNAAFNLALRVSGAVGIASLTSVFLAAPDPVAGLHALSLVMSVISVVAAAIACLLPLDRPASASLPVRPAAGRSRA
ncbi:MFS transporter [Arsenicicoccus sp. oral taxon 190]|uniref:MFS transporter n=1 Tax=Arsenicicoccus sp. oral taxon 190 TaxID=1658671 RepID=UPI00067A029D|nr:MFS transporter [Arsenicicoccus sp. oral taxon 190]AKT52181.1 hypothetical protein ADJ73_14475 [Arsenicicoccus sp. oral taxon 190]